MTATGAEAGSDLAPVGPRVSPGNQGPAQPGVELPVAGVIPARWQLVRIALCLVLGGLSALAAWYLLRHGIRTDDFPPFIDGAQATQITRYSGPWLTAAAGMALVAALFLLFAVVDTVRRSRGPAGSAE